MNITSIDMAQFSINASQTCINNNGYMTDSCLYKILCTKMSAYFHNYIWAFFIVGVAVVITGLIINRIILHKNPDDLLMRIKAYKYEALISFYYISACIMFFIIQLYFNS
jgi:ATP sulfurylase